MPEHVTLLPTTDADIDKAATAMSRTAASRSKSSHAKTRHAIMHQDIFGQAKKVMGVNVKRVTSILSVSRKASKLAKKR